MKLGIYIQVPFCRTKCTYCNFPTGVFARELDRPYAAAVVREIREFPELTRAAGLAAWERLTAGEVPVVDTVYLGGGTPSLLESGLVAAMLSALRERFSCAWEEATLEADPETVTREKVRAWRAAGIDRISLGAQSFDDRELRAAGRLHRSEDVSAAAERLRAGGFSNLSFDLIAGLPHQTAESWKASLEALVRLRPEHVSIYLLEVDEASRLGREVLSRGRRYGAAAVPEDDALAGFYDDASARLAREGYEHYEISNWALPGFASRHNRKYWRREPYLGFGAGAHSFDTCERWANEHAPERYIAAIGEGRLPAEQRETITGRRAMEEEIFLGLRQLEGIDLDRLEQRYRVDLRRSVESLRAAGLVELEGERLRLRPERLTVSNEVFIELLG
jgi:putative oxygen-independent coproporphyrinogen III oxidase